MSRAEDYLLEELDPDETAAFERAMAGDPALRDEVERLRPVVTRLQGVPAEAWEGVEPPPLRLPQPVARARRLVLRPALAAVCALALLGVGIGLGVWLDRDPAPTGRLALAPVGKLDPGADGRVSFVRDGVEVRVSGLKPTDARQFYELWLLGADKRLVGLGSFRVGEDGTARLRLPLPVDPKQFTYFDLSLEPTDGDPGHSGVSVLRGTT
jgi:anti-sigma-K factor RskA